VNETSWRIETESSTARIRGISGSPYRPGAVAVVLENNRRFYNSLEYKEETIAYCQAA
jgi:hypothetical protein